MYVRGLEPWAAPHSDLSGCPWERGVSLHPANACHFLNAFSLSLVPIHVFEA